MCHDEDELIILKRRGERDLIVMSLEHYERLQAQSDLFAKLGVAREQAASGAKGITHKQMMRKLHSRINAG